MFTFRGGNSAYFPGGGSAVEFYMLVSGVFFFRSFYRAKPKLNETNREKYPFSYIIKRYLRFFPYTSVAFAITFFIRHIFDKLYHGESLSLYKICVTLSRSIWEFLLVEMNGMNRNTGLINGPTWYISAMLISEFIILCILVRNDKLFYTFIAPISILFGYGFWANLEDTNHYLFHGFTTFGVMRVFMVTCIAYYIWCLSEKLNTMEFTRMGSLLLSIVEVGCHIIVIWIAMRINTREFRWCSTLLYAIAISITLSSCSYSAVLFKQSKITDWLGEFSMSIYLIHIPVRFAFLSVCNNDSDKLLELFVPYVIAVFAASIVFMYGMKGFLYLWKKYTPKFKNVIIKC